MKKRTDQKEDYLKEIFINNGVRNFVSNKVLAQKLNVSAASVSEMINKLKNDGYVEYVSYKGVKLNDAGIEVTSKIIYNHRVFETFLYEKLGYSIYEVHTLAEELEHIKDEDFFNRLYEFLDHPKHCPHGGVISSDILKSEDYVIPISHYPVGTEIVIKRFEDNYNLLLHIEKIGLKINDIIAIVENVEKHKGVTIRNKKQKIELPFDFAEKIFGISVS